MITTAPPKVTTAPSIKPISGQRKWLRIILLIVLGYEAAGCLLGGSFLIAAPDGRLMDLPVSLMNGFFPDFFIPGIILFALGILNTVAFIAVLRKSKSDWVMASLALYGLIIWFWIEITILQELHWLHIMWGLPVIIGAIVSLPLIPKHNLTLLKGLLISGIMASLLYISMNVFIPMRYAGYNSFSQTVSEISAIDAPTRPLWVVWASVYSMLLIAFGIGILLSASRSRPLRIVGILMIVHAVIGIFWPPMHQREFLAAGGKSLTDTLHIVWTFITVPLFMLEIGFGAAAFGKRFRWYAVATIVVMIFFGMLTGMASPQMEANLPTPWLGVWERIIIGAFMIWVIVFAVKLLQKRFAFSLLA